MVVVLKDKHISDDELKLAKEEYGEYIKVVVDVDLEILAAGGEWHADAEKILIENGSRQNSLWGGGIDLSSGTVDFISLINTRPGFNNSQEVSSEQIRSKMERIIKIAFNQYV